MDLIENDQRIADQRFLQILDIDGIPLQQSFRDQALQGMFPNAEIVPQFFQENLVSDDRVLKQFLNNCHSNIRVFYFQLLRLGYEIKPEVGNNRRFILNLKRIVFHPDFEILFTEETEEHRQFYNDFQFKRFFAEFVMLLDRQDDEIMDGVDIQKTIGHYPIMDMVFIHILRSLLAMMNINEQFDVKIPTEIVFQELSNMMGLKITSYGNCWQFEDSDMFCYEQNENEIYLAYIPGNGDEFDEEDGNQVPDIQPQLKELQSIQLEESEYIHPDAIKADSKIVFNVETESPKKEELKYHQRQSSSNEQDTPQFQHKNEESNRKELTYQQAFPRKLDNQKYFQRQHHTINQTPAQTQTHYNRNMHHNNYSNNYNKRPVPETQHSSYSKPTNSMISQNYEFVDYLGVATTEKHKVPKRINQFKHTQSESKLSRFNSYSNFMDKVDHQLEERSRQNHFQQSLRQVNNSKQKSKFLSKYKPPAYYNNQTYQYTVNNYYKSDELPESTPYKHDNFNSVDITPLPFIKYRNAISTIKYQDEHATPSAFFQQKMTSKPSDFTKNFKSIYEEGRKVFPIRPVTKFIPVSPTPMPDFSKYRTKKQEQFRDTSKTFYQGRNRWNQNNVQHYKPYQTQQFNTSYHPQVQQNRSDKYQVSTYNSPFFKQYQQKPKQPLPFAPLNLFPIPRQGDYDSDFTPPQILRILRSPNRDNIYKIREQMSGLKRGRSIPQRVDLMRSAIYQDDNSQKEVLYRNQSRDQFQYEEKNKKSLADRFGEGYNKRGN